jgi:hypothetical protein
MSMDTYDYQSGFLDPILKDGDDASIFIAKRHSGYVAEGTGAD